MKTFKTWFQRIKRKPFKGLKSLDGSEGNVTAAIERACLRISNTHPKQPSIIECTCKPPGLGRWRHKDPRGSMASQSSLISELHAP